MTLWYNLPKWIRARASADCGSERMLSAPRFQAAMERERMRADRSQGLFSLVEFTCPRDSKLAIPNLVHVLDQRLRATDEFGPIAGGIGVLLPETDATGARQFAESIASATAGCPVQWIIRQYPGVHEVGAAATAPLDDQYQPAEPEAAPTTPVFVKPLPLWKRTIDVLVAACGLLVLSPVLLLAAIAIKLTSPGPVLFLQLRAGLGGKPFIIYKLRTMTADAEAQKQQLRALSEQDGPAFKIKNDPRITTVGKYLRKTCLDELPQLWNVLKGDMTLVGPRPLPCDESDACRNWERRRLDVTPGLTCIWQVRSGRSRIAFADWMRMDLRYIHSRGLAQDVKLLWKTFLAVILHRASH